MTFRRAAGGAVWAPADGRGKRARGKAERGWGLGRLDNDKAGGIVRFPDWITQMAATLTQERLTGPWWLFEQKFDGIRLLAYRRGDEVQLFSRNRLPQHLPSIAAAIGRLPVRDAILDGELVGGRYHIFDVMWLDGRDV